MIEAVILLLALALRLISLNQSLWLDESISAAAVKTNSFIGLITQFSPGDVHPPLYYLLLKIWTDIFGYSEVSLRLPSVIAGVVTVYFVFKIGERLFDRHTGLAAALFMAINPLAIYYSQEARMYSLETLAVVVAIYTLITKRWVSFVLALIVSVFADYVSLFILPSLFLIAKERKKVLLAFSLAGGVFLLWMPILLAQFRTSLDLATTVPLWGQVVGGFSLKSLPLTLVKFIFGRITLDNKILYLLIFGSISALYSWMIIQVRNKQLWLWLALPLALGFIISLKIPLFTYHRFLFTLPAFLLLLAKGVARSKPLSVLVLLVSIASVAAFNLNSNFQREDWRGLVNYMQADPGVAVIPSLAQAPAITYYDNLYPVYDKDNLVLDGQTPVYLLRYVQEIFDPQDLERNSLEAAGYKNIQQRNFNGVVVWKYSL